MFQIMERKYENRHNSKNAIATSSRNCTTSSPQKNLIQTHNNIYDDEETTTSVVLDEFEISSSNSMITNDAVSTDVVEEISSMDTSSTKVEEDNCIIENPESYNKDDFKKFSKKQDENVIKTDNYIDCGVILDTNESSKNDCMSKKDLSSEIFNNIKNIKNDFGFANVSPRNESVSNINKTVQKSTNMSASSNVSRNTDKNVNSIPGNICKLDFVEQTGESQNAMFLSLKKMSLGSSYLGKVNLDHKSHNNIKQYKDDSTINTISNKNFQFINSCALHSKIESDDNRPSGSNNMNELLSSEVKELSALTKSSLLKNTVTSSAVVQTKGSIERNDFSSLSENLIKIKNDCNPEINDKYSTTAILPYPQSSDNYPNTHIAVKEETSKEPQPSSSLNCIQSNSERHTLYLIGNPNVKTDKTTDNIMNIEGVKENSKKINGLDELDELKFQKLPSAQTVLNEKNWIDSDETNSSDIDEICTCNINANCKSRTGSNMSINEIESVSFESKILGQSTEAFSNLRGNLPENCNISFSLRKRKFNEIQPSIVEGIDEQLQTLNKDIKSRKRVAYDSSVEKEQERNISTLSAARRTPRSLIPTRENPPPELEQWLCQFQHWSNAERLLAIDCLIDHCNPTQVRHMMKIIEPQFQRDFISLLPRELALSVLSYLEPKDLLKAAQTCRSWRFLCDDNLLWKEKCRKVQIMTEPRFDRQTRGRACPVASVLSPWKAAYMRQHIIEMNWRTRPIREPKILKGHDDHVITCLQFSGNRIVSGSDDNTLKVWSAVTGRCLRTLIGHTGGVWSSQMSGNIIISGSTDRTLKVWDMETGQCIHTLMGHTSTVRCMHLHGNKVVSGSRDATLRVWDIQQGNCLHVLIGHLAAVRCVQYDGKLIVSGAYDYMVKIWHPERQECLHTLQGHTNRVYSLQFDGLHVVSGSLDTSIRVWDVESGSCKHTLMGHQSLTSGMELRQNILVSGNADSTVKVWDITTGQCLQTLSGPHKHQSAVTCLQFNSRFVVTSSDDGTVKLWDVKTGEFIRNLVSLDSGGSGGVVWRIRANDTKLICAVGSRNGTEETKLMVLDFDVEGACLKCS